MDMRCVAYVKAGALRHEAERRADTRVAQQVTAASCDRVAPPWWWREDAAPAVDKNRDAATILRGLVSHTPECSVGWWGLPGRHGQPRSRWLRRGSGEEKNEVHTVGALCWDLTEP
ncbi:hypothetical protein NDU88_003354 [Pleurodeles waltl]|uniref:Uncharacterized protein n=1 Tax=Pleurodeles waltl TaxID=8319 RepID=A0AAV7TPJ6_PLEWA|nr:hypothetical protein NDU88_003354 [Pleurodeles waltl]